MPAMTVRRVRASLVAATTALTLLAGCGDDADDSTERSAEEAQAGFASDLLQHDAQVLALLDLARERDLPADAATALSAVQMHRAAEVETLTTWLSEASMPIPATVRDHVNAGHGDHPPQAADDSTGADLPGMPDAEALERLDAAEGTEFVRLLGDLLAELSHGATELADDYGDDLRNGPLAELADGVGEQRAAESERLDLGD